MKIIINKDSTLTATEQIFLFMLGLLGADGKLDTEQASESPRLFKSQDEIRNQLQETLHAGKAYSQGTISKALKCLSDKKLEFNDKTYSLYKYEDGSGWKLCPYDEVRENQMNEFKDAEYLDEDYFFCAGHGVIRTIFGFKAKNKDYKDASVAALTSILKDACFQIGVFANDTDANGKGNGGDEDDTTFLVFLNERSADFKLCSDWLASLLPPKANS